MKSRGDRLEHRAVVDERGHQVSCELGSKETTEPTGGSQHRKYLGGPTNGLADACRRRLAAAFRQ